MKASRILGVIPVLVLATALAIAADKNPKDTQPSTTPSGTNAALPKLVDLGADKCIPCKMMAPVLAKLKTSYAGQMEVQFIDVWRNPDAGEPFKIKLIPTQIFFAPTGKELFRHEGFFSEEDILKQWKELGFTFTKPDPKK